MKTSHPALFSGIFFALAGLILSAALFFGWLPHCHGEKIMRCVWMTRAAGGTALMIAALGYVMLFTNERAVAMGIGIGVFFAAILEAALATVLIGPCPSPMMLCHAVTQPTVIVSSAVLALFALADVWRLSRRAD